MRPQTATRTLAALAAFAIALGVPVLGRPRLNMTHFPRSPADRRIDHLGAEARIQTETDAEAYVAAFVDKFELDEVEPRRINAWKSRLARAEFDAVRHPKKRIPEEVVAAAFNQMMERWKVPAPARVSVDELHILRTAISIQMYPQSMALLAAGQPPPSCRPTEALYLVYLLQARGGFPAELENVVRTGKWPNTAAADQELPMSLRVRLSKMSSAEAMRLSAYLAARTRYFADQRDNGFQQEVEELFRKFRID